MPERRVPERRALQLRSRESRSSEGVPPESPSGEAASRASEVPESISMKSISLKHYLNATFNEKIIYAVIDVSHMLGGHLFLYATIPMIIIHNIAMPNCILAPSDRGLVGVK